MLEYLNLREYGVAPGGSGPGKTDGARSINLQFLLRFPKYIYGVVGRDRDQYGNLTENVGTTTQPVYIGLQNKYGIDGGKIWTSTTPITEVATDTNLIDVIDKDSPDILKKGSS